MSTIGYARVSTTDQDCGIQEAALHSQGDSVGSVVGVEFGKNVFDTTFDCLFRYIQFLTDRPIARADGNRR